MFARPDRIIVPQYAPPQGIGVLACAELLGESKRAVSAALVDLAVRGNLGMVRRPGRRDGFDLVLRRVPADDGSAVARDDLALLGALFPDLNPGDIRVVTASTRREVGADLRPAHREAVARLVAGGLVRERGLLEKAVVFWRKQPTEPTERAAATVDHLWGVHDYIAWAEADRLAFHQSTSGAAIRELDGIRMLHLHERLLPYAVLFGLERSWLRELAVRYDAARVEAPDVLDATEVGLHLASFAIDTAVLAADLHALGDLPDLPAIAELGDAVDFGNAFEAVGSFFGGLGEFVGGIDL